MSHDDPGKLEIFSREWYNEYFRRAATSQAHARFCEQVYGRDLCQHGLMHMEELDLLVSLIEPGSTILEVGCSNGRITEYIHDRVDSTILGIDFSDVAIEQARRRVGDRAGTLRFACVDLTQEEIPGDGYDYILAIDSLYFLGEFDESLRRFDARLNRGGRMVISIFSVRDEDEEQEVLLPHGTDLGRALRALDFKYRWYDFTAAVREHGIKNYEVGEALKADFEAEGNRFLYKARAAENRHFRDYALRQVIARYLYLVDGSGAAYHGSP